KRRVEVGRVQFECPFLDGAALFDLALGLAPRVGDGFSSCALKQAEQPLGSAAGHMDRLVSALQKLTKTAVIAMLPTCFDCPSLRGGEISQGGTGGEPVDLQEML